MSTHRCTGSTRPHRRYPEPHAAHLLPQARPLMWTEVSGQPGVAFWVNEDWMDLLALGSSDLPCTVRLPFPQALGGLRGSQPRVIACP